MDAQVLAALFDLARSSAPLVNFAGSPHDPGYDLYSKGMPAQQRALEALVSAGLATTETWADATFYRLDDAARAALGV